jgi:hypothetical protein
MVADTEKAAQDMGKAFLKSQLDKGISGLLNLIVKKHHKSSDGGVAQNPALAANTTALINLTAQLRMMQGFGGSSSGGGGGGPLGDLVNILTDMSGAGTGGSAGAGAGTGGSAGAGAGTGGSAGAGAGTNAIFSPVTQPPVRISHVTAPTSVVTNLNPEFSVNVFGQNGDMKASVQRKKTGRQISRRAMSK